MFLFRIERTLFPALDDLGPESDKFHEDMINLKFLLVALNLIKFT